MKDYPTECVICRLGRAVDQPAVREDVFLLQSEGDGLSQLALPRRLFLAALLDEEIAVRGEDQPVDADLIAQLGLFEGRDLVVELVHFAQRHRVRDGVVHAAVGHQHIEIQRAFGVEHELALLLVISRFFEADGDVVADGRPAVGGKESGGIFAHEAGQLPHDVGVAEYDGGVAVHVGEDVHARDAQSLTVEIVRNVLFAKFVFLAIAVLDHAARTAHVLGHTVDHHQFAVTREAALFGIFFDDLVSGVARDDLVMVILEFQRLFHRVLHADEHLGDDEGDQRRKEDAEQIRAREDLQHLVFKAIAGNERSQHKDADRDDDKGDELHPEILDEFVKAFQDLFHPSSPLK